MVGRLREGVTLEQAQREMVTIGSSPAAEFPRPAWASMQRGLALESLHASVTSDVRPALLVILGAVLLLLAIACANVTNILLARALARRDELATRAALGAEPGRLVRQLFAENALLTCAGGVLGIGIAALASRALVALAPADLPRLHAIGLDARVLGFAFATTAVVALVAGLVAGAARPRYRLARGAANGTARNRSCLRHVAQVARRRPGRARHGAARECRSAAAQRRPIAVRSDGLRCFTRPDDAGRRAEGRRD